jgi:hypothetical protein
MYDCLIRVAINLQQNYYRNLGRQQGLYLVIL